MALVFLQIESIYTDRTIREEEVVSRAQRMAEEGGREVTHLSHAPVSITHLSHVGASHLQDNALADKVPLNTALLQAGQSAALQAQAGQAGQRATRQAQAGLCEPAQARCVQCGDHLHGVGGGLCGSCGPAELCSL